MYRQTKVDDDKVVAKVDWFNDHKVHELHGECKNFLKDKFIPFGSVRYICPTTKYPEIRLRFTPAAGLVYGADKHRIDDPKPDPVFVGHEDRIVYDTKRGSWLATSPTQRT